MIQDLNDIVLRPRFKVKLTKHKSTILSAFKVLSKSQSNFIVSCVEDHVFIKLPKQKQQFWSPQLQLEILEFPETGTTLHGLFGPSPTVWTLFMFIHFFIGLLFIGLSILAYTKHNLNQSVGIYLWLLGLLIICWFGLYAIGRIGKYSSKDEMKDLYNFMRTTINTI